MARFTKWQENGNALPRFRTCGSTKFQPRQTERFRQNFAQHIGVYRLDEMLVEPGLFRPFAVAMLSPPCKRNHDGCGGPWTLGKPLHGLITIEPRHADVQENEL